MAEAPGPSVPKITPMIFRAEALCRVPVSTFCEWFDNEPATHRDAVPGDATVEILERSPELVVYRMTSDSQTQTVRRVRLSESDWSSEIETVGGGTGRFKLVRRMTVSPEGSSSRILASIEATPLDLSGTLNAWVARRFRSHLAKSAERSLEELAREAEAANIGLSDPDSISAPEISVPAASRLWGANRSSYSPSRDWARAGIVIGGIAGVGVLAVFLALRLARIVPPNILGVVIVLGSVFGVIVLVAFGIAAVIGRLHSLDAVEAVPSGIILDQRTGNITVPWEDLGLWGMRVRGDQYVVRFRHDKLGTSNTLWLTRGDARVILSSPYCPSTRPSARILLKLGLRLTKREGATALQPTP